MKRGEIEFLNQLINSLEEAEIKLSNAYEKRDSTNFNKIKKFILQIQKRINEILR